MASGEEAFGEVRADEAGAAGDEKPHACVVPFVLFAR